MGGKAAVLVLYFFAVLFVPIIQARIIKLVTLEYPPYEFQTAQGASGIAVEIISDAFKRIDQPFSIQFLPWARAIREVNAGRVDGIFTIYKTPQREVIMNYSQEVLIEQSISFFTLKSKSIYFDGRLASLSPYRIGIVRKVSYGEEVDKAIQFGTLESIVATDTGLNSFKLLLADRVDVVISNQLGGMDIIKRLNIEDKVKPLTFYSYSVPSYIAFTRKKHLEPIRQRLDSALRDMKADGTHQEIIDKYLKQYKKSQSTLHGSPDLDAVMVNCSYKAVYCDIAEELKNET